MTLQDVWAAQQSAPVDLPCLQRRAEPARECRAGEADPQDHGDRLPSRSQEASWPRIFPGL